MEDYYFCQLRDTLSQKKFCNLTKTATGCVYESVYYFKIHYSILTTFLNIWWIANRLIDKKGSL